jgi:hypothetical protein
MVAVQVRVKLLSVQPVEDIVHVPPNVNDVLVSDEMLQKPEQPSDSKALVTVEQTSEVSCEKAVPDANVKLADDPDEDPG